MLVGGNLGSIISLSLLQGESFFNKNSLENAVADLVDLISLRLKRRPLEEVAEGLLENVFDLRIGVFEWLSTSQKSLSDYDKVLNQIVQENISAKPFTELHSSYIEVVSVYSQILDPIKKLLPDSFADIHGMMEAPIPSYNVIKGFSFMPIPQFQSLAYFVDASLRLEIGFIATDLVLTKQLVLTADRIKSDLIDFLYTNIIRFGAYAISLGLWQPAPDEYSNIFNKMEILAARFELDQRKGNRMTFDELSMILNQ